MRKALLTVAILLTACFDASAQSPVWKVQKGEAVIYLGATCHLLRPQDFPLPSQFDQAFKASEVLIFETDIGALGEPASQQALMSRAVYPDSIEKHLSPKVYGELKDYCESKGFPLMPNLKASVLMVTLGTMELMQMGAGQAGPDKFFYDRAVKEKKAVRGLETIEEQIGFLVSMADGKEDEYVSRSLEEMKEIKEQYAALVDAWRNGAAEKLDELVNASLRKTPELYAKLIVGRNRAWLPKIERCLETPETEFILVGAAHLVGKDGVLEALKKDGARIEQLR